MCTLTLVPCPDGARPRLRIGFNRDEQRTRLPGLSPQVRRCGSRLAVMPIDPVSDGTWIAVNDAGLAAALLNQYEAEPSRDRSVAVHRRSRGEIVPRVMGCSTMAEALDQIFALLKESSDHGPFRLVLTNGREYGEFRASGATVVAEPNRMLLQPTLFTSSGLGDALVQTPRKLLFASMFEGAGDPGSTQDAFHRHRWQNCPELSVCMVRPEARTVSYTVIEMGAGEADLTYYPAPPDERCEPTRLRQPRVRPT